MYDIHLRGAMQELLPGGQYTPPTEEGLKQYLTWDDWRVLGMLADGRGGEHGQRLLTRNHYRLIYFTRDNPPDVQALFNDEEELQAVKKALGDLLVASKRYSNNWYKHDSGDIPVIGDHDAADVRPLSEYSSLLRKFTANDQELLYVKPEDVNEATPIVQEVLSTERVTQLRMEFPTARRKEVVSAS